MKNAERIAKYVIKHGSESIIIHSMPATKFWLIMQKVIHPRKTSWRAILCNPDKETWRLISDNVSDRDHITLWHQLTEQTISYRIKQATKELKKCTQISNKNKKQKNGQLYTKHTLNSIKKGSKIHSKNSLGNEPSKRYLRHQQRTKIPKR